MIVWGGAAPNVTNTGARYDPSVDTWLATATASAPSPRVSHTAVWADGLMIVWGGQGPGGAKLASGGRYAFGQSADDDGDGFTDCGGDCDDLSASVYPGALEACNGLDDDCDGIVDTGGDADLDGYDACRDCDDANPVSFPGAPEICDGLDNDCDTVADNALEICDGLDNDCNGTIDDVAVPVSPPAVVELRFQNRSDLTWPRSSDQRAFDVVRGSLATLRSSAGDFTSSLEACIENESSDSASGDTGVPGSAVNWYYVVRAVGCGLNGSYDEGSPAQQGSRDAEIAASEAACP